MDVNKARTLFFEEAYEQCDHLEQALLDRESYPANPETYNLMFRTAHTIKGSASMLGLTMLVRFAHAMENMLARLRSGELQLDEHLINLLLACNDQLRDLLQGAEHNPELPQTETQQILALLSQLQGHQSLPTQPVVVPPQSVPLHRISSTGISLYVFIPRSIRMASTCWPLSAISAIWARSSSSNRSGTNGRPYSCSIRPNVSLAMKLACAVPNLPSGSAVPSILWLMPASSAC